MTENVARASEVSSEDPGLSRALPSDSSQDVPGPSAKKAEAFGWPRPDA